MRPYVNEHGDAFKDGKPVTEGEMKAKMRKYQFTARQIIDIYHDSGNSVDQARLFLGCSWKDLHEFLAVRDELIDGKRLEEEEFRAVYPLMNFKELMHHFHTDYGTINEHIIKFNLPKRPPGRPESFTDSTEQPSKY